MLTWVREDDNYSHVQMTPNKKSVREAEEIDRWCAAFEQQCRSRGIRVTPQRLAVYRVLAEDSTHPTAESVYDKLRERMPSLSQATVYRILELLENKNLIRRVSAIDGVGRFDANLAPHQHVVCRACGKMSDFWTPALHRISLPAVSGFLVQELDIRIVGLCQQCSALKSNSRLKARKGNGRTEGI